MKKISGCLLLLAMFIYIGCRKDHPTSNPAKGSLQDESGNCLPGTVHGVWFKGITPNPDTNYIAVGVEVTRTGSYKITTDRQNGVIFSDSGEFTNTGLYIVRLKATGSFTTPATTNFTTSFDGSTCGFSIHVQDSSAGSSIPVNTWTFTTGGHIYSGPATGQLISFPPGPSYFRVTGPMASGSTDSTLFLQAQMAGPDLITGAYPTSVSGNGFDFTTNVILWQASSVTFKNVVNIQITSTVVVNGGSRAVAGTFSGQAVDPNGILVDITNGAFNVLF